MEEECLIVEKKFVPPHIEVGGVGRFARAGEAPGYYIVKIKTSKGDARVTISKEEFDSYRIGERVSVKFKRHPFPGETVLGRNLRIESMEKIKSE